MYIFYFLYDAIAECCKLKKSQTLVFIQEFTALSAWLRNKAVSICYGDGRNRRKAVFFFFFIDGKTYSFCL